MVKFSGSKLRKHREAVHMSRMDLARAIDFAIGPQQIARYENGSSTHISLELTGILAVALKVSVGDLTDAKG